MNDRRLQIFVMVCEKKGMTKAARELYMTQPAVSQVICELENYYQIRLFERLGKQLILTEAGKMLYRYAKTILGMYRDIERNIHETEGVCNIYVGANLSVGAGMLTEFIRVFNEKYPTIRVYCKITGSSKLVKMLDAHELDFGLMEDLTQKTDLVEIPFAKDRTVVVSAPEAPILKKKHIYLRDLEQENILLREKGSGVRDRFDAILHSKGVVLEPLWECSSTEVLIKAVQEGIGISVLPYQLIKRELNEKSLAEVNVEDINLSRNLNIVYSSNRVFGKPVRDFMEIVKTCENVPDRHW